MVLRLDGGWRAVMLSRAKCSTEGEWGEVTVTKKVIQAAPQRKRDCVLTYLKKKIIQD